MNTFEQELNNFNSKMQSVYGKIVTDLSVEDADQLQRTEKWKKDRAGNFTGSKMIDLMSCKVRATKNNPRDWRVKSWLCSFGDTAFSYILSRAIERATGEPTRNVKSVYMDWGNNHEEEGKQIASDKLGVEIEEVGFIKFCKCGGASPDGFFYKEFINEESGEITMVKHNFELKCPATQLKHYKHMNSEVVEGHEYFWQVQSEMMALKCDHSAFATYDPSFPESCNLGIKWVDRSEVHCNAILFRCVVGDVLADKLVESDFKCDLQEELNKVAATVPDDYEQIKIWINERI